MANVSQAVQELEFFSLQLKQDFIKIRQRLDVTSTGRLSAGLLPPHNLSQILQQVALRLPNDTTLIARINLEDTLIYYEVALVHAYATTTDIRLVIRFPLRGTDRVMNLYRTKPLPICEAMLGRHVQIIPEAMYMAVLESRQYYSLLTSADLHKCQQGLFTICESEFPLYHKGTPSCSGALYFGKHEMAHEHCNKIILWKDFKPVWIHYGGIPRFWIYSLPLPIKITKTCRHNGTIKSADLEIKGTGILYEEENCQVFSERFLLLSMASGYMNFTLTRGQVVIPELLDLLTEEETRVLERHQDQTDRTLGALVALMTRSFTTRQEREVNLRDLLDNLEHNTYEKSYYKWVIAAIVFTLILVISYITSRFW